MFTAFGILAILAATAAGQSQWTPNNPQSSLMVNDWPSYFSASNQFIPSGVQPDGQGGWFMAWAEYTGMGDERGRMQHFDRNGNKLWGPQGQVIHDMNINAMFLQQLPGGRTLLMHYGGPSGGLIEADLFDKNGNRLWGPDGKVIIPTDWFSLDMTADLAVFAPTPDGGFYASYVRRFDFAPDDFYVVKIDANGNRVWPGQGKKIATVPYIFASVAATPRPDGSVDVAFTDNYTQVYVQHLDSSGDPQWGPWGKYVSNREGDEYIRRPVPDGQGGFILVWGLAPDINPSFYGQRFDAAGNELWEPEGRQLTPFGYFLGGVLSDGAGGFWLEMSATGAMKDIYVTRMDNNGKMAFPITPVCTAPYQQHAMSHIGYSDPSNPAKSDLWIAWPDGRRGVMIQFDDIYCQRVRRDGTMVYQTNGFPVTSEYGLQAYNRTMGIATASGIGMFVGWIEQINGLYFYQKCELIPDKANVRTWR